MLYVLDNDNPFDDEEDNSASREEERHLQDVRRREDVRREIKRRRRIGVGVENGNVTSFPLNFSFPHNMMCDKLVTNWFIGDSDRKIMEYRRLSSKDISHVKREQHNLKNMEWFMKVVEKYAHEDNCWMETSSKVTAQKVNRM